MIRIERDGERRYTTCNCIPGKCPWSERKVVRSDVALELLTEAMGTSDATAKYIKGQGFFFFFFFRFTY
jgi:hypothetical protein